MLSGSSTALTDAAHSSGHSAHVTRHGASLEKSALVLCGGLSSSGFRNASLRCVLKLKCPPFRSRPTVSIERELSVISIAPPHTIAPLPSRCPSSSASGSVALCVVLCLQSQRSPTCDPCGQGKSLHYWRLCGLARDLLGVRSHALCLPLT